LKLRPSDLSAYTCAEEICESEPSVIQSATLYTLYLKIGDDPVDEFKLNNYIILSYLIIGTDKILINNYFFQFKNFDSLF